MDKKKGQLLIDEFEPQESVTEEELTEYIIKMLSPYFKIYRELRGEFIHWNQKRTVIIDLGLYPRKETIEGGFPEMFFGIEVKSFDLNKTRFDNAPKFKDSISQCLTYKYSKFGNSKIEPAFILFADNYSVEYNRVLKENKSEYRRMTNFLFEFIITQNVGRLIIKRNGDIGFRFGTNIWHSKFKYDKYDLLNFYAGNRRVRKNPMKPF